jgi:hypothetical protein
MLRLLAIAALAVGGLTSSAQASVITTFYGDDDGFGIGATGGTIDPTVSHAGLGEAPFTDVRLIGNGTFIAPAFAPTGDFDGFVVPAGESIIGATLTMRAGSWVSGPDPVNGPNQLLLDGMAVPTSFFDSFTNTGDEVETRSIALGSAFFPLLADGLVSLNGTLLSENFGSGSFQIDFLRLDVVTEANATPEPATLGVFGVLAAGAFGLRRRVRATA